MIFARLKMWSAAFGLLAAALLASWFGGRKAAQTDAKINTLSRRLKAVKEAEDVRNEVEALSHDALRHRATVWVRKPKR